MNKIRIPVGIILLCLLLIPMLVISGSGITMSEYEAKKQERDELKKQNATLTEKLEEMNGELKEKYDLLKENTEASNNLALKEQSYTQLLASCLERYNVEKELLTATTELMNSINGEISKLEETRERLESNIAQTIRNLHETGTVEFFEFLLDSNGILDFLKRFEYVTSIMEQYDKLIKDAEQNTEMLEERYSELEVLRVTQQETVTLLESRRETYDAMIANCLSELETLKSESEVLESFVNSKNEEIEKIEAEIDSVLSAIGDIDEYIKDFESNSFFWPCKATKRINSEYGNRILNGKWNLHKGIDINARYDDIYASKTGVVITAQYSSSYGYCIVIAHSNGIQTWYAHLSKMSVKVGETVKGGQKIGVSGNSGWSTGPHLHFEIRKNGTPVNPLNYKSLGLYGVDSYVDIP